MNYYQQLFKNNYLYLVNVPVKNIVIMESIYIYSLPIVKR